MERLAFHERWPGVVAQLLGDDWTVIENGLCGRTTTRDDPIEGAHLNGLTHLPVALAMSAPLDMIIIMLGTNDLKTRFNSDATRIANQVGTLVECVWAQAGEDLPILVVCPPQAKDVGLPRSDFTGAEGRSEAFPPAFGRMAVDKGVPWLDAGEFIVSSDTDGVHLDVNAHRLLGEVITDKVRSLI